MCGEHDAILCAQLQSLIIFMSFHGRDTNDYEHALITHLIISLWEQRHKTTSYKAACADPSMFNESVGEMSLSVLARSLHSTNPNKMRVDKVSTDYRLIRNTAAACGWTETDLRDHDDEDKVSSRTIIKDNDPDIELLALHFKAIIARMLDGTWQHCDAANWDGRRATDPDLMVEGTCMPQRIMSLNDMEQQLIARMPSAERKAESYYTEQFTDEFPHLAPRLRVEDKREKDEVIPRKKIRLSTTRDCVAPPDPISEPEVEMEEDEGEVNQVTLSDALGDLYELWHIDEKGSAPKVKKGVKLAFFFGEHGWDRGTVQRPRTKNDGYKWEVKYINDDTGRPQILDESDRLKPDSDPNVAAVGSWVTIRYKKKRSLDSV